MYMKSETHDETRFNPYGRANLIEEKFIILQGMFSKGDAETIKKYPRLLENNIVII